MITHDVVILGGGIVGCATAQAIRAVSPKATIAIVEAMPRLAAMQSSRNSGVVHCGIFYKPESSYATLCVQGTSEVMTR
jgi:L-2-hydroxyglutarate oxidase LhgO